MISVINNVRAYVLISIEFSVSGNPNVKIYYKKIQMIPKHRVMVTLVDKHFQ